MTQSQNNKPLETALQIMHAAHKGQFRRDGVTPYIEHPLTVAKYLEGQPNTVIMAALLHDVIEDSTTTAEELIIAGIPQEVVDAVVLLTKKENEPYGVYLEKLRKNSIARIVKLADIAANLNDSPTDKQIKKYIKVLPLLINEYKV